MADLSLQMGFHARVDMLGHVTVLGHVTEVSAGLLYVEPQDREPFYIGAATVYRITPTPCPHPICTGPGRPKRGGDDEDIPF